MLVTKKLTVAIEFYSEMIFIKFFSQEKAVLWIEDLYFSWKQVKMMDLFHTNMQLLASQDINWWTGVVWISCGFLWLWWHPFTAEDPLMSKWCDAKFLQICSDEETNSSASWMTWGWVNCQQICISGWTIPLSSLVECLFIKFVYNVEKTFPECLPKLVGMIVVFNFLLRKCLKPKGLFKSQQ